MNDHGGGLEFPDGPRAELDRALADVLTSAQRVLATQGRLRSLLSATTAVTEELDLPRVLRRIIESGMRLVGARYGAMGVVAPDGRLEQFIHVGMSDEQVERIGHLPEGHGLLGALIEEQHPIRLEHLQDDPRSSGFPRHHPPMNSFLGVPIRVRDEAYGNLYLSESSSGAFTEEDEDLLKALASSAAIAIDNARLFAQVRRQQAWSAASAEISAALLDGGADRALELLAERAATITDAALVCVVLPTESGALRVAVARGPLAPLVAELSFDAADTLAGRAIEAEQPVLGPVGGPQAMPVALEVGPAMAVPLRSPDGIVGALTIARPTGAEPFQADDVETAADFSDQASVALELAKTRADRERLSLLDDRARIARDLHDHVIQRLFGAGLSLQSIAARVVDPKARQELLAEVGSLDAAIADIRTAIFAMTASADDGAPALRHQVIDLVNELAPALGFTAQLTFTGAVDLSADDGLADDALAVIREALSNVARHAEASAASVDVTVADGRFTIMARDDGVGSPPSPSRSSGLGNLRERAATRSGSFSLEGSAGRGTVLTWSVPLTAPGEDGAS